MQSDIIKILYDKVVTRQEHLELLPELNDLNFYKIIIFLFKKIFRNIYNSLQRLIVNPKYRSLMIKFELLFKKKKIHYSSEDIIKHSINLEKYGITFFDQIKNIDFEKISNGLIQENNLYSAYQDNEYYYKNNKPERIKMGYISTKNLINNEEILKLINNKKIVETVNNALGTEAIFDNLWAWWSFANSGNTIGSQNFHRDYNSLNFLKLFVYLTNVDEKSGPQVFVKGSAVKNKLTEKRRFSDLEVEKNFEKKNIFKINGKKNTVFLANTFSLHKGLPPISSDRLLLCVLYSVNPSRACPKFPLLNINDLNHKELYLRNKYLNKMYIKFN